MRQAESATADDPDSDVPSFEFLIRDKVADVLELVLFISKVDFCIGRSCCAVFEIQGSQRAVLKFLKFQKCPEIVLSFEIVLKFY